MSLTLPSLSGRSHYRVVSIALLAAVCGWISMVRFAGYPEWVGFIIGAPFYIFLIFITYHRLRGATLSGAWIIFMILTFRFGPEWNGFSLGLLINLFPVVLAWIAPSDAGANAQAA